MENRVVELEEKLTLFGKRSIELETKLDSQFVKLNVVGGLNTSTFWDQVCGVVGSNARYQARQSSQPTPKGYSLVSCYVTKAE